MSALGGYTCAVIANRNNYLAPGLLSLLSTSLGAYFGRGEIDLKQLLMLSALTVVAVLGGASLHNRKFTEG